MSAKVRLQFILAMSSILWLGLVWRLGLIQIVRADHYQELAARMSEEKIDLKAQRGNIYDRNGVLLATDVDAESFFAVPDKVEDPREVATLFSLYCNEDTTRILKSLSKPTSFVWLSRRVEKGIAQEIKRQELKGVYSIKDSKRFYPHTEVAAHLIGFVGDDGIGLEGIERQFDQELSGTPGWTMLRKDARGKDHSFPDAPPQKPLNGNDLYLTIDIRLQEIIEDELAQTVARQKAKSGKFILLDPNTGEIVASAVVPGFDLNAAAEYPLEVRRNRIVTDAYEPGSTFKFVTAAIALEEHVMDPNATIYCEKGSFDLGIHEFHDASEYGWLTFTQVIEKSSNVGVYKIAREIGSPQIYEYALKFGFGCESGSGLTGEARGMLRPPAQWSPLSIMAIPIGQEVSVTTLQLANAFGVIANGGELLEPQILSKMVDDSGTIVTSASPKVIRRVLSPQTASILTEILTGVVERGTGTKAQIPGLPLAGKTGTAQKKVKGIDGYAPDLYVASFVGFFPADDPKLVGLAVIDEPRKDSYGGDVAAPLFKRIAERITSNYNIVPYTPQVAEVTTQNFPLVTQDQLHEDHIRIPDWRGLDVEIARDRIRQLGLYIEIVGTETSRVWHQHPAPGTRVNPGSTVQVHLNPTEESGMMPALVGLSVRQAKRELDPLLVDVSYVGGGIVVEQTPSPGTPVLPGERCQLVAIRN